MYMYMYIIYRHFIHWSFVVHRTTTKDDGKGWIWLAAEMMLAEKGWKFHLSLNANGPKELLESVSENGSPVATMGFNTQLIIHDLDDARGTLTSETSILW